MQIFLQLSRRWLLDSPIPSILCYVLPDIYLNNQKVIIWNGLKLLFWWFLLKEHVQFNQDSASVGHPFSLKKQEHKIIPIDRDHS